jgi:hypothetical protein
MHREDDIIRFDAVDKSRYSNLPEWAPIEAVPGIFETLTEQQQEAIEERGYAYGLDIMDVSEHIRQHKILAAERKLRDLGLLREELGRLAPDEIAASIPLAETLPGIKVAVLHQK